jgi:hypothetical protein
MLPRRKILVGQIVSIVQIIWPKAYISENNTFLRPTIKEKGHNILLM